MFRKNLYGSLLVCSALLLSPSVWAVSLTFNPSTQTAGPGDVAHVEVVVSGLEASDPGGLLAAYDLTVNFNPALLSPGAITLQESPFGTVPLTGSDLSVAGSVSFNLASLEDDATLSTLQGDSIVLATIDFNVLALGTTPLTFAHVDLTGANAQALTATPAGGEVTAVPLPSMLILLVMSTLGLVSAGWRTGSRING